MNISLRINIILGKLFLYLIKTFTNDCITEFNIEILGKDTKVKAQTYHAYESAFIKYYEQNYNEKPILCCNSYPDY